MAYIVLIDGGDKYYIECQSLPAPGSRGPLTIQNCERATGNDDKGQPYEYLALPCSKNPADEPPVDLTIELQNPLSDGNLVMPFNGGTPDQQISIKYI